MDIEGVIGSQFDNFADDYGMMVMSNYSKTIDYPEMTLSSSDSLDSGIPGQDSSNFISSLNKPTTRRKIIAKISTKDTDVKISEPNSMDFTSAIPDLVLKKKVERKIPLDYADREIEYKGLKYIGPTKSNKPNYKSRQAWDWDIYPHGLCVRYGKIRVQIKQKGANPTYDPFPNTLRGILDAAFFRDTEAIRLYEAGILIRAPKLNFEHPGFRRRKRQRKTQKEVKTTKVPDSPPLKAEAPVRVQKKLQHELDLPSWIEESDPLASIFKSPTIQDRQSTPGGDIFMGHSSDESFRSEESPQHTLGSSFNFNSEPAPMETFSQDGIWADDMNFSDYFA
mmetsp:Transcript_2396/g.3423  ORF Transcript_2396/g.3423 Transcript_2396/m.3423 type:complete len:337 (-) Transcript_2396:63-1073(-)|eukprot:CAMPEP_0167768204 /NCGR_PEP_ID=MMETSP0110_2-20121227/16504_1 /TAXON_ID=629695 /ORGANISM="Gymnochlora sp., Strain CCMP2014" /LENGTH=336 /DNA_ID=CAMNT_0007656785 /DNA_START=62 /DNA_END=1072 /DNA_ORIENTATION=+